MQLLRFPDESTWLDGLVSHWQEIGSQALQLRGEFVVALSGGSTPAVLYKKLAASKWPWEATTLYIGDERWVPRDHKDSNYRMIFESFYPHQIKLERWKTELAKPEEAAVDYSKRIKNHLLNTKFDLVLLGIGTDGHTASLFPGTSALGIEDRLTTANWVEQHDCNRLTFTYPLIKQARNVWFVASGDSKKPWIDKMASGTDTSFPAARVECEGSEPVIFFNEA